MFIYFSYIFNTISTDSHSSIDFWTRDPKTVQHIKILKSLPSYFSQNIIYQINQSILYYDVRFTLMKQKNGKNEANRKQYLYMITINMLIMKNTSPNAPLPITVNCSKSSIPILCLCNLIYSVSFFSKFLIISSSSSLDICASCAFLCSARRLKTEHYQLLSMYIYFL